MYLDLLSLRCQIVVYVWLADQSMSSLDVHPVHWYLYVVLNTFFVSTLSSFFRDLQTWVCPSKTCMTHSHQYDTLHIPHTFYVCFLKSVDIMVTNNHVRLMHYLTNLYMYCAIKCLLTVVT